jgi:hypothetical protein
MSDRRLHDAEHVARAIFLPAMLDSNGKISLAAFTLRHNEGYFSVARMAVEGWLDDLKLIPISVTRQLGGYCKMEVGDIRNLGFTYNEKDEVAFDVEDKATTTNNSHAGILLLFGEDMLKGDKETVLKPLPTGVSATGLLMLIQTKLSQLAGQLYVAIDGKSGDGNNGDVSGSATVNIEE